jgi:hypothetical protein
VKDKLVIGAHIHIKVLRPLGKFDDLFEVKHDFISLWGTWRGNPLCVPVFAPAISWSLRPQELNIEQKSSGDEENHYGFRLHAEDPSI